MNKMFQPNTAHLFPAIELKYDTDGEFDRYHPLGYNNSIDLIGKIMRVTTGDETVSVHLTEEEAETIQGLYVPPKFSVQKVNVSLRAMNDIDGSSHWWLKSVSFELLMEVE